MVTAPGTINIRSVPGRFGEFNVGTLECTLGTFSVKDPSIEEFVPGVYYGDFVIEKIKPSSYISGDSCIIALLLNPLQRALFVKFNPGEDSNEPFIHLYLPCIDSPKYALLEFGTK